MTVFRNEGRWDTSNVAFVDGEIVDYSKRMRTPEMQHIDYGFSVVKTDVFIAIRRTSRSIWRPCFTRSRSRTAGGL